MPLFEFICRKKKCEIDRFEKLVFGQEELLKVRCPGCGGLPKKVLSIFNYEMNGFNADNGYSFNKKGKK